MTRREVYAFVMGFAFGGMVLVAAIENTNWTRFSARDEIAGPVPAGTDNLAGAQITANMPADVPLIGIASEVHMLAGVGPDGKQAPIQVDGMGHVICSKDVP